jgi:2-amino-4-hydroxy-6-hydroxymethyldihydropteridine diphosphokinase
MARRPTKLRVSVDLQSHRVYLSLGTNLGDRLANLEAAREAMPPAVQPFTTSSIYETPPWGYLDQPAFLNQVVGAETNLAPKELLDYLKALEIKLGRSQTFLYGPRLIDIDILFYDDLVLKEPDLTIPHPRLTERAFVLAPLVDIAPDLFHPLRRMTIRELSEGIDRTGIILVERKPEMSQDKMKSQPEGTMEKYVPDSEVGFSVTRRPDGGMQVVFTQVTHQTLKHWREFALAHLEDSNHLTTNMYDLRQIEELSDEAIQYAVEVNTDPSVRNIRLAVVVASERVRKALQEIDALSAGYGVEMGIFTDIEEAESWLNRPLTLLV